jgi:hypothetical protein
MTTRMVMLLILCMLPATAQADEPLSRAPWKERAVLRAGQIVQGDYFAFGPHVEISGIVNGDLYAAGGEVLIDGVVNGDVIVAGAQSDPCPAPWLRMPESPALRSSASP